LKIEVNDFADLFIKRPGYIHNFKHVHWIDFIAYADEGEELKVLINVNAKTFIAKLALRQLFLTDNPSAPAFIIELQGLRSLAESERDQLSSGNFDHTLLSQKQHTTQTTTLHTNTAPSTTAAVVKEHYEDFVHESENLTIDNTQAKNSRRDEQIDNIDMQDLSIDIDESLFEDEEKDLAFDIEAAPQKKEAPKTAPKVQVSSEAQKLADSGFVYDPTVASNELGLPLDLIEEFIEDFIAQSQEFKPKIYASLDEGDVDNVKILAHKLKGVAANLRVEDAHELLSNISASTDASVIRQNIDAFYMIMQKLAKEDQQTEEVDDVEVATDEEKLDIFLDETPAEAQMQSSDDKIDIVFDEDDDKIEISLDEDEALEIADDEVPQQIDIPELADDDFYQQDLLQDEPELLSPIEEDTQALSLEDEIPPVNYSKEKVASEIGLSVEDFNELFADFEKESLSILATMRDATQQEKFDILRNEALKLKGMSDNMRLEAFTKELSKVINITDKNEILNSINKLEQQLIQISMMGA